MNETVLKFWYILKFYLQLKYYELLRWLAAPGTSKQKFQQSLVILGDDFGFGFGDKYRIGATPGIGCYIGDEMAKDTKIKQSWKIYNLGKFGSTTSSWLPKEPDSTENNYLQDAFLNLDQFQHTQLVLLLCGYNDDRQKVPISSSQTLDNLKKICRFLSQNEKIVYLFTIPTPDKQAENFAKLSDLNKDIVKFVQSENDVNIKLGVQIDRNNFEYRANNLYNSDTNHFTPLGYKRIAKDWFQSAVSDLVKVEFKAFSKELGFQ